MRRPREGRQERPGQAAMALEALFKDRSAYAYVEAGAKPFLKPLGGARAPAAVAVYAAE